MQGKLILIEGTDCSGKETQAKLLCEYLNSKGIKTELIGFPDYDSPTGRIVGGPYLGKKYICEGWFPEGADKVSPKVSALYYGADFLYHLDDMKAALEEGKWVVLDRYFYSTYAHQGGKIYDAKERQKIYKWFDKLEKNLLGLLEPHIKILLYMPYQCSMRLNAKRKESADELEKSIQNQKNAEVAYLELAKLYDFKEVKCNNGEDVRTIEEIHADVIKIVENMI